MKDNDNNIKGKGSGECFLLDGGPSGCMLHRSRLRVTPPSQHFSVITTKPVFWCDHTKASSWCDHTKTVRLWADTPRATGHQRIG